MGHGHCHCFLHLQHCRHRPARRGHDNRLNEALRAERRKSNQLEKEIRTLRQQLNRFSEINPEEYARLQEAERQKQILEQKMELRERQMGDARGTFFDIFKGQLGACFRLSTGGVPSSSMARTPRRGSASSGARPDP